MYIKRALEEKLKETATQFAAIALLGPRQSGKTTLAQEVFRNHTYLSLEDLDIRELATQDPRNFFETYKNEHGLILDEFQNTPEILSYIQSIIDKDKKPGYFILTGSQNFLVNEAISQSLAGRIAIFTLLPLCIQELTDAHTQADRLETLVYKGMYPALHARTIDIGIWASSYMLTYIERDVRMFTQVNNLVTFKRFMQLCAGRTGQLLNIASLASDCEISPVLAKSWLSILEASYIIFLLQPHHKNFNKRLVKTPKLYFYDTGLACALLAIESEEQLSTHYLRGGLIETFLISDVYKQTYNLARQPHIYFWRDNHGHEVDCLIEKGVDLFPIEIKAGKTPSSFYFTELHKSFKGNKIIHLGKHTNITFKNGSL